MVFSEEGSLVQELQPPFNVGQEGIGALCGLCVGNSHIYVGNGHGKIQALKLPPVMF